jgi:hypothetical protein
VTPPQDILSRPLRILVLTGLVLAATSAYTYRCREHTIYTSGRTIICETCCFGTTCETTCR